MTGDQWVELARRVTAAERQHHGEADQLWHAGQVIDALREKGVAEGLDRARDIQLEVSAEARNGNPFEPSELDGAMHSVWLHGKWQWLTRQMTTEQREASADAVQRYSTWLNRQDEELAGEVLGLRWWAE